MTTTSEYLHTVHTHIASCPYDPLMQVWMVLNDDIELGLTSLSRDELLDRIGDVSIATRRHPQDLPEPLSYAWEQARPLKASEKFAATTLMHMLEVSFELLEFADD